MKIEKISRVGVVATASLCVLLAVGCGPKDDAPTAGTTPVRGEPIQAAEVRGEPIQTAVAKAKPEAAAVEKPKMAAAEPPALAPASEAGATLAETAAVSAPTEQVEKAVVAAEATVEAVNAVAKKLKQELSASAEAAKATVTAKANDAAVIVKDGAASGAKQAGIVIQAGQASVTLNAGETLVVGAEAAKALSKDAEPGRVIVASTPTVSSKPKEIGDAPEPRVAETAASEPPALTLPKLAPDTEPEIVKSGGQNYLNISFERLASFEYEMPDEFAEVSDAGSADAEGESKTTEETKAAKKPEEKDQIPATVRKFNNKRIALEGFMLPLKVEDSLVTEMLIMRDQSMCCFGSVPKINEWVSIRMTGKGVQPVMDEPVTIYGKLKVGEIRENGYLVGIYEMDGERMGSRIDL